MNKAIRNALVFLGAGIFCLLLGLSLDSSTGNEKHIKNLFLFGGISIINLYLGFSWKKPSYGGGIVHKYAGICIGVLCGLYTIYIFIKLM